MTPVALIVYFNTDASTWIADDSVSICDGDTDLKTLRDRLENQGWRYSYARGSRYIFHRPAGELPDTIPGRAFES